jgi:hypothetical protein
MLLHIIKLLLKFLTTAYTIVVTGYSIPGVIRKFGYKVGNCRTSEEELINNAAPQNSHKSTSAIITGNEMEQQCDKGNTTWKRFRFAPALKFKPRFPLEDLGIKIRNSNFSRIFILRLSSRHKYPQCKIFKKSQSHYPIA